MLLWMHRYSGVIHTADENFFNRSRRQVGPERVQSAILRQTREQTAAEC